VLVVTWHVGQRTALPRLSAERVGALTGGLADALCGGVTFLTLMWGEQVCELADYPTGDTGPILRAACFWVRPPSTLAYDDDDLGMLSACQCRWLATWPRKQPPLWRAAFAHTKSTVRDTAAAEVCVEAALCLRAVYALYKQATDALLVTARTARRELLRLTQELGGGPPPVVRLPRPSVPPALSGLPCFEVRRAAAHTPLAHRMPLWSHRFTRQYGECFDERDFQRWARRSHIPLRARPLLWAALRAVRGRQMAAPTPLNYKAVRRQSRLMEIMPARPHARLRGSRRQRGAWGQPVGPPPDEV
jgi:hypothetical protein